MKGKALNILAQAQPVRVQAEAEPFTLTVRRANTSKENEMAKDLEGDEGPPPPKPVDFDDEKANSLLGVVHKTRELPTLSALNQSAMMQLAVMAVEVQEDIDKRNEEYQKAMADWKAKKAQEAREEEKANAA